MYFFIGARKLQTGNYNKLKLLFWCKTFSDDSALMRSKIWSIYLLAENCAWFSLFFSWLTQRTKPKFSQVCYLFFYMVDHTKHEHCLWLFCQLYKSCILPLRLACFLYAIKVWSTWGLLVWRSLGWSLPSVPEILTVLPALRFADRWF